MSNELDPDVLKYWRQFCDETGLGDTLPYDVFQIGNSPDSADNGLRLILDGIKTTTSSLPEDFRDKRPPRPGDLSIVTDGQNRPGCVVETINAEMIAFDQVSEDFARNYGEWDRTLETWRKENGAYYKMHCRELGIEWSTSKKLICETFKVVHVANA